MNTQVVLITGALTGIGRATAVIFAQEGAHVVVSGRRDKEGQELATELLGLGAEAIFVRTDVRNEDDVRDLVDRLRGTPEKRPMRDTSKPANENRQDKVVITQGRTSRQRKISPGSVMIGYSDSTWAEDMAPQGCDQSADPEAGNAWAAQAAFAAFPAGKR
jgi:hypothetical protein